MSLADDILGAEDLGYEAVTIPEWNNVTLYVHALDGEELFAMQGAYADAADDLKTLIPMVFATKDAPHGSRVFQVADAPKLLKKSGRALRALIELATTKNLLSAEADKNIEKNSDSAPS